MLSEEADDELIRVFCVRTKPLSVRYESIKGPVCKTEWHLVVKLPDAIDWVPLTPTSCFKHKGETTVAVKLIRNEKGHRASVWFVETVET